MLAKKKKKMKNEKSEEQWETKPGRQWERNILLHREPHSITYYI